MNIGIDARFYGPIAGGGGLGRYVEELVTHLVQTSSEHWFTLFVKPETVRFVSGLGERVRVVPVSEHWYTVREQLWYGRVLDREKVDLLHVPHWNVPWFVSTPYVMTLHDLILLEEPVSTHASTRHPLVQAVKYRGFKLVIERAIRRAQKIICVSEATREALFRYFPWVARDKVVVIPLGFSHHASHDVASVSLPDSPYLLSVGNAYPHKNLSFLLEVFKLWYTKHPEYRLVLAGRKDAFYERLQNEVRLCGLPQDVIHFRLNPSDADLGALYKHAFGFVFPSRIEGFGLPALEAQSFGTPVVASNSSSLPEILGESALYFSPTDIASCLQALERLHASPDLRKKLVEQGSHNLTRFSWVHNAQSTLDLYSSLWSKSHPLTNHPLQKRP